MRNENYLVLTFLTNVFGFEIQKFIPLVAFKPYSLQTDWCAYAQPNISVGCFPHSTVLWIDKINDQRV